ncbi:hypothetical protein EXIGLDRAFT_765310 [Exidia glandulosa HHB12029]|uniref:F-box domain-containing protein n=1 Tax=Exidia glandulosa HHB12029 TaxID=1314781 RepID=A0A165KKW5_EXIGL|nr:hypothetical protein EXIGLDRAFT_765310 [Exidia glandulosa HHB12029]
MAPPLPHVPGRDTYMSQLSRAAISLPLAPAPLPSPSMPAFGSVYTVIRNHLALPELPLDLYRPILAHLRGDQKALRRCALVNRNMYAEAMILLYERIEFSSTAKIVSFVEGMKPDIGRRVRALCFRIDISKQSVVYGALLKLLSSLTELTELKASLRASDMYGVVQYGAMLLDCPSDKLVTFEWDSMYSAPVRDFISRQNKLEDLAISDGTMVVGRHDEFPADRLTHLRRITGDARWITQLAKGRPIESVVVTRTSLSATSEMLRVLSNSRGPCTSLASPISSALSGLYPGDVLEVARWLPNLVELGDCYLYDPYTMAPTAFFLALQGLTSLQKLRVVDNSDWEGGKFDVPDAQKIHQAVPTLRALDVISMAHTSTRSFVRRDVEIHGGRATLFNYVWTEHVERNRLSTHPRP